jgi:hypothetical protein
MRRKYMATLKRTLNSELYEFSGKGKIRPETGHDDSEWE